jgi:hypothetical protein
MNRKKVDSWNRTVLAPAMMSVGLCDETAESIGISMHAVNGDMFAHGHYDLEAAKQFYRDMGDAIAKAELMKMEPINEQRH